MYGGSGMEKVPSGEGEGHTPSASRLSKKAAVPRSAPAATIKAHRDVCDDAAAWLPPQTQTDK